MKEFIKGIIDADGNQWFGFIVFFLAVAGVGLLFQLVVADRTIRYYYPSYISSSGGTAYLLKADINWMEDPVVYTNTNQDEMLRVMDQLNKQLKEKQNAVD